MTVWGGPVPRARARHERGARARATPAAALLPAVLAPDQDEVPVFYTCPLWAPHLARIPRALRRVLRRRSLEVSHSARRSRPGTAAPRLLFLSREMGATAGALIAVRIGRVSEGDVGSRQRLAFCE